MKPALLHGYIICDRDGRCQAHTFATNRADCWKTFTRRNVTETIGERRKRIPVLKRQGFRCARVWVTDAEVKE